MKSMTHASKAGGGAGTSVAKTGKTAVRSTLKPVFGKRAGSARTSRRGGRR